MKKGIILIIYCLILKYMLFIILPFLLAVLSFMMMKPIFEYIQQKWHIQRHYAKIMILVLLYLIVVIFLVGCGTMIFLLVTYMMEWLPNYYQQCFLPFVHQMINEQFSSLSQTGVLEYVQMHSIEWLGFVIGYFSLFLSSFPRIILSCSLFLLASFFLFIEYDVIVERMISILRPHHRYLLWQFKDHCLTSISIYMKCQMIIIIVCFVMLSCGFVILKINHAFLFAFILSLLDTLPFIGIGIGLFPMIFIYALQQNYIKAMYLLLLYFFISMTHSILEPHLMNKQMKIPSFILLFSMIVHIYIFGMIGVVLSPIHMNIIYSLSNDGFF